MMFNIMPSQVGDLLTVIKQVQKLTQEVTVPGRHGQQDYLCFGPREELACIQATVVHLVKQLQHSSVEQLLGHKIQKKHISSKVLLLFKFKSYDDKEKNFRE